jgi:hypothetical protein
MPNITRIDVRIKTGNINNAGTDGTVFLAIAGREFHLDSAVDDFEKNSDRTYILGDGGGAGSTNNNPALNNPQGPFALNTVDLEKFPMWIRFEPSGDSPDWNLEFAGATVNPGPNEVKYQALAGGNNLWLGQNSGKYCFMKRV